MDYFETRDNYYDSETTFSNTFVRTVLDPTAPMYQFYKGLNIFLTGASGFMGKVFIEKVLRCYPEVGAIYILMRPKKNKTVQERIEEQFKDELFDRVKREQSDILQRKVHFISGDLNQPLLGISCSDQDLIRTRVHVIVHAAASLRMDELVKDAFTLNVEATKQLLELATQCTQLKTVQQGVQQHVCVYQSNGRISGGEISASAAIVDGAALYCCEYLEGAHCRLGEQYVRPWWSDCRGSTRGNPYLLR
uniref:Fatty acyl-CoA reductase n=1 Tax=Cacopsylla melanoneura TaxID=428564 RepID=A0A8D8WRD2_9HEMI